MNSPAPTHTLRRVAPAEAAACVPGLAEVLIDCVQGGASVGFMWPLPRERALAFWAGVARGVEQGERILMVAEDAQGRIVGTVQGIVALPDNQPHRADVAKMLVHRSARRLGLAERLLAALSTELRAAGKTLMVLDTVTGGDAERLYARHGWQLSGVIPDFALMPDGAYCSTTIFYKRL